MKNDLLNLILKSNSIVLLTHENPDGDAIGSVMAFYYHLISINKNVDIIMQNVPPVFSFLNDIDKVVDDTNKNYDLAIVLDCSSVERIGQLSNVFGNCKHSINIDHHLTNTNYGDINYIKEDSPACCQIIYYLFKDLNISIDKDISTAIICGTLTDTNGFRNNNVDEETFLMAAEIRNLKIDVSSLYTSLLCMKSETQFLLTKMAIDRLEFFQNGKIAFSYVSKEDLLNVDAQAGDHEGLVEIGRNIAGVVVSIFVREDNGYRVSIRSNGEINASEIAAVFNGGGHYMAAGCKINMDFKETKELLLSETIRILNE